MEAPPQESAIVTKKEIVKKISEDIGLTQLKTKDIVQRTLDAIIHTLVSEGRIELRNFGVFEVKRRAPRKARNPRTGDKVFVHSARLLEPPPPPGLSTDAAVNAFSPSALRVRGPTTPSAVSRCRRWKRFTARRVMRPKSPSTGEMCSER